MVERPKYYSEGHRFDSCWEIFVPACLVCITYWLVWFSGMLEEEIFGMYHQTHCRFYNDFAYDTNYEGAATTSTSCKEGERLAKLIGNKSILFMGNHGLLLTGPTAAVAFDNAYFLERACMMQVTF